MSRVPQYKVNVHVASILSMLGLPTRAEEPFYVKRRKIPDFVTNHSVVGGMLGEAEIGTTELDSRAVKRLTSRAYERFEDLTFKGYDVIMLLIYPQKLVEEVAPLPEDKIERELMERSVGLGIAVRKESFNMEDHYVRWYSEPVKIIKIPQVLNILINGFFKELKKRYHYIKDSIDDLVDSINTIMDNTSRSPFLVGDPKFVENLADIARKLGIAWNQIKKLEDKVAVTTKFILLLSTLIMIFYEVVRNERLYSLKALECQTLDIANLAAYFEDLILDKNTNTARYAELNSNFIKILKGIPSHQQMNTAIQSICREIKNNYVLIRRLGWDILSMLYQRMLSETYRHAFATFYTKLPAARLLASLAIEQLDDEVIDPACGTGSLLLASVERRRMLLRGESLRKLYKEAIESDRPLLNIVDELILKRTAGLDALKPSAFIAALNLRIATRGSSPNKLNIHNVSVGFDQAGSLDLLTSKKNILPREVRLLGNKKYDLVIMNPPFTRSDRISFLIGEDARQALLSTQLYFGGTRISNLFTAGMAKPFLVLADRLLKEGGRIAAVLPSSILSRPSWKDVRKELLESYDIEYIVISWAPGTPNFSSDTRLREILLVAEKKSEKTSSPQSLLKIVNLYKKIDDMTMDVIESISRTASTTQKGVVHVIKGNETIASIVSIDLKEEIRKRLENKKAQKAVLERKTNEELEKISNNLYRFIAFKSGELLKMHLDIVFKCSTQFKNLFRIGSVVDHTNGLSRPRERGEGTPYLYETPALWGSGKTLNIRTPWLERAPFRIGVIDETRVRVKYWKPQSRTFYRARIFVPRKVRLSTQYVLMAYIDEPSISNVWWPLEPLNDNYILPYLVYMNSVFGFINILGERLETEGLYMEIKKKHLGEMPVPDLEKAESPTGSVIRALESSMPRFDQYIEYMADLNKDMSWYDAAQTVIKEARNNSNLSQFANRALLDLKTFEMLHEVCKNIDVPRNLYVLLKGEVDVLKQIMEQDDTDSRIIEDVVEKVEKKIKFVPLDKWLGEFDQTEDNQ